MTINFILFFIVLPIALIFVILSVSPKFINWFEVKTKQRKDQLEFINMYERSASRFLRETLDDTHPLLRKYIIKFGEDMIQGSFLVKTILSLNNEKQFEKNVDINNYILSEFNSLSKEQSLAFNKAFTMALYVSCYQSTFHASKYVQRLSLLISNDDKPNKQRISIKPKQIPRSFWQSNMIDLSLSLDTLGQVHQPKQSLSAS